MDWVVAVSNEVEWVTNEDVDIDSHLGEINRKLKQVNGKLVAVGEVNRERMVELNVSKAKSVEELNELAERGSKAIAEYFSPLRIELGGGPILDVPTKPFREYSP